VNRNDFIKILAENGVFFDHHGKRHDVFVHRTTGKKIPVPRHSEMKNKFLKRVLDEIPRT
jgi:predicted RNA binding protein YcfA (HicA-like mRNA interferase family)